MLPPPSRPCARFDNPGSPPTCDSPRARPPLRRRSPSTRLLGDSLMMDLERLGWTSPYAEAPRVPSRASCGRVAPQKGVYTACCRDGRPKAERRAQRHDAGRGGSSAVGDWGPPGAGRRAGSHDPRGAPEGAPSRGDRGRADGEEGLAATRTRFLVAGLDGDQPAGIERSATPRRESGAMPVLLITRRSVRGRRGTATGAGARRRSVTW